ncbi:BspA type Leucine rich repeat region (6 copies) [Popillia japonica]|uniref:BspA type Leucine rich repeat region (6 copies) n=1 Tax=Popillia japonica TaxID=7064 RepID=A0AAW1MIR0_POPJA
MVKHIIVLVILCSVNFSSCACPKTFRNAMVTITDENGYQNEIRINDCLHNSSIRTFSLLSRTKKILKDTFYNLTNLERIEVRDVGLYVIEPKFAENIPNVAIFDAYKNQIEIIENNVFNNFKSWKILLDSNRIFYVEDGAFHGMHMTYLNLNDNQLSAINSSWFYHTQIYDLALAYNKITSLDALTFSGIFGVEILWLQFNKINYIAHDTFSIHLDLKRLYLSGNSLLYLDFNSPKSLQYLDVSFNLISSILFENTTELVGVSIYPNPLICKCLLRFWKKIGKLNIEIRESLFLKTPLEEEYPMCIAANYITCGEDSAIADNALYKEYFKLVNYCNLWDFSYRR